MSKDQKSRIRYLPAIIFSLFVIAGAAFLLYPTISDYWNKRTQSQVIQSYQEEVEELETVDYESEFEKAREYNKRLYETPGALYYPERVSGYNDVLNVRNTGIMGYVTIPSIKVKLPIYHGATDNTLTSAVGHIEGTSVPVGGENTHAVIAAHRGQPSARLFTDIDKLDVGDKFTITVFDTVLIYEVDSVRVVLPEENQYLEIVKGMDLVTLQTCTPYGVNSHRLLVRGRRIGTTDASDATYDVDYDVSDAITDRSNLWVFLVLGSFFAMLFIVTMIRRKQNKKYEKAQVENDAEKQAAGSDQRTDNSRDNADG